MASVIQISEAASLALHSMVMLAAPSNRSLTVKEMTVKANASEAHLSKVMQRLSKAGLVKSTRGPKGGFILGDKGLATTLLEIYQAIEGPIEAGGCLLDIDECPFQNCLFGGILTRMTHEFKEYMQTKTLRDMVPCKE